MGVAEEVKGGHATGRLKRQWREAVKIVIYVRRSTSQDEVNEACRPAHNQLSEEVTNGKVLLKDELACTTELKRAPKVWRSE
jgi:hypothetical protein